VRRERAGRPTESVRLALGAVPEPDAPADAPAAAFARASADPRGGPDADAAPLALAPGADPLVVDLGEAHYLRSEESWEEAGRPSARVRLAARGDRLALDAAVRLGRPTTFVAPGTTNVLDNERAAVNGDGVQLHVALAAAGRLEPVGAWLLVPVSPGDAVDVTRTSAPDPAADAMAPSARWRPEPGGYALAATLPLAPLRARAAALGADPVLVLDVLVNEMPPGRERRRGQLVLGGAGRGGGAGTFVYLRGDRHDPARGVRLRLPPAP
jgi:hypothetical protein